MEGKTRSQSRTLRRVHDVSRLESDLWAFVYEYLQPWTVAKVKLPTRTRPTRVRSASQTPSLPSAKGA
jgi:hypothetical protein